VPSLDGTLLASLDASATTLILYDLGGQVQGQYTTPDRQAMTIAWLPDSSGLFAWEGSGTASGPLQIVDRHGHAQATGMQAGEPFLSPDGQWVAATLFTDSAQLNKAEVVARAGGQVLVLAQGADVLGWQGNRVVYWSGGNLYTSAPNGGSPQLLVQVPGGEYLRPIGAQLFPAESVPSAVSPDGQALIVDGRQDQYWMLAGAQLSRLPAASYLALPVYWVGPHSILGHGISGSLVVLDVVTGTVVHDVAVSVSDLTVEAVAGVWIAGTELNQSGLYLINSETKAQRLITSLPVSTGQGHYFPLGKDKFLIYLNSNAGAAYIVDPAVALG
jgi:hypothetical protein